MVEREMMRRVLLFPWVRSVHNGENSAPLWVRDVHNGENSVPPFELYPRDEAQRCTYYSSLSTPVSLLDTVMLLITRFTVGQHLGAGPPNLLLNVRKVRIRHVRMSQSLIPESGKPWVIPGVRTFPFSFLPV